MACQSNNKKANISVLLTSIILIIRDVGGIDVNQYVLFALMSLIFVFLPRRDAIIYLAYTCGIITGVNGYILLVGLFSVLCKDCTYLHAHKSFIFLTILVVLWECFNSFLHYPFSSSGQVLLFSGYILAFFYYLTIDKDKVENKQVILYYSIGLAVTLLVISIGVLRNPLDMIFDGEGVVRAAMGFGEDDSATHFVANANNLAYFSIVLMALAISLKKQVFSSGILFWTLLTISLLSGILSRSRTWLILTCLLVVVEFISRKGVARIKFLCSGVALIFVAFYCFSNFIDSAIDGFLARLELDNISTAGNRTILMKEYFDYMSNHLEYVFSGTGAIYYKEITMCSNSCHNAFQQIYIAYGVLGFVLFIAVMIKSLLNHNLTSSILNYLPFAIALLFIQTIQLLNPFHLMIPLAVSSVAYKIKNTINT